MAVAQPSPSSPQTTRSKPGPDVFVVGYASTDENAPQPPATGTPTYYFFIGQKEKPMGKSWAGEKYPSKAAIESEIVKSLASQHYIRSTKVGDPKPSLVIMALWGTAGAIDVDLPDDDDDNPGGALNLAQREMMLLVGGNKQSVSDGSDIFAAEQSAQAMRDDRVYVMLGAFDADAMARKPPEPKLVWRTVMSIDTLKDSFPASLATMLQSAAPFFGRNTDTGILVDDKVRREGRVELGEMIVIPDKPDKPDKPAKPAPAKPSSSAPSDQPDQSHQADPSKP